MNIFYSPKFWAICSFLLFFSMQYSALRMTKNKFLRALPSIFISFYVVFNIALAVGLFARDMAMWNIHMILSLAIFMPIITAIVGVIVAYLVAPENK